MGKVKRPWQEKDYVLVLFAKREREARSAYFEFVTKGVGQGRRPDLVGGGLLRSVGGWKELKELRDNGLRVKGDERILGGSDFVEKVLREANERFDQRVLQENKGLNPEGLLKRVAAYTGVNSKELCSGSRSRTISKARSILCYLAVRELGLGCNLIAGLLNISPSAVSKSLVRGQQCLNRREIEEILK
jgi:putative transposase